MATINPNISNRQIAQLLRNQFPSLNRIVKYNGPGGEAEKPPFQIGESIQIAPQYQVIINSVKLHKHVWSVLYTIKDTRPKLLVDTGPTLKFGKTQKQWRMWEENGYTTNITASLTDCGEAVDGEFQNQISKEANQKWEKHQNLHNADEQARKRNKVLSNRLNKTIYDKIKKGIDITPELVVAIETIDAKNQKT